jgi:DNA-binding CsgD family transcriptional regulator
MVLIRNQTDQALAEILGSIYEAAIQPSKWRNVLDQLDDCLDGVTPILCLMDHTNPKWTTMLTHSSWQESAIEYSKHYNALNPWAPYFLQRAQKGKAVIGDEIISQRSLRETEFYNDFFRQMGEWDGVVGVLAGRTEDSTSILGLHCSRKKLDREHKEIENLAVFLAPHIAQSFEITRRLGKAASIRSTMDDVLAALTDPAIIVRESLTIEYANPPAQELFKSGIVTTDQFQTIRAGHNLTATRDLRRAIQHVLRPMHEAVPPATVRLSHADHEGSQLSTLVVTIHRCGDPSANLEMFPNISLFSEPRALLLFRDLKKRASLSEETLRDLYDLTPAEARLANALLNGATIADQADRMNLSQNTLRTQMKSIFSKTGTNRQADLVANLIRLSVG